MTQQIEICSECGKRRRGSNESGSLTQWIFEEGACVCGMSTPNLAKTKNACGKCGKALARESDGSWTQWIFRASACSCESGANVSTTTESLHAEAGAPSDVSEEEQLDLADNQFPTSRYKPLVELGRGRTGIVYLSRDRLLGKKVAVKTLRMLTGDQLMQFQTEARILCKLSHPNIVSLLDFGCMDAKAPYMVLEYFDAVTLQEHIEKCGPLTLTQFISVSSRVCKALAKAHGIGIFHRDMKPSNILVAPSGDAEFDVRVIDFGTAGLKENRMLTIPQGITIAGTPAYMAPDMAAGRPFDARSEVYSLGCVFFEALTGEPPFMADEAMSFLHQHAHVAPPRLSEKSLIDSPELDDLIAKCLAKDPEERFGSIEELSQAIANLIETKESAEKVVDEHESETDRTLFAISPWLVFSTIAALAAVSIIALVMFVSQNRKVEPTLSFDDTGKIFAIPDKLEKDTVPEAAFKRARKGDKYLRMEKLLRVVSDDKPKPFAEKEKDWLTAVAAAKEVYGVYESSYRGVRKGCMNFFEFNKKFPAMESIYRRDIAELQSLDVEKPSGDDVRDLEESLYLCDDMVCLADVLFKQGKLIQAEREYSKAYAIRKRIKKIDDPETACILKSLGDLYRKRSDFDRSRQCLSEARSIVLSNRSATRVTRFDVLLS